MLAKRILITVWLCLVAAVALPAQEGGEGAAGGAAESHAAEGAQGHGQDGHDHGHHGPSLTMEMTASDIFKWQFDHSVTYPIGLLETDEDGHEHEGLFTIYNVQPWQWTCLVLMLLVFMPVVSSTAPPLSATHNQPNTVSSSAACRRRVRLCVIEKASSSAQQNSRSKLLSARWGLEVGESHRWTRP